MLKYNTWVPRWSDIMEAIGILTRLPVEGMLNTPPHAHDRGAAHTWAYPVVGIVLGLVVIAVALVAQWASLPFLTIGFIIVALTAGLTGAMHEDGLADTLDGFWGGWTPTHRLEIMKDSHIGVYGVTGLVIVIVIKASLWANLVEHGLWGAIIGVLALSRAVMVPVMAFVPHARKNGLSVQVGRPVRETALLAMGIGGLLALLSGAWLAVVLCPLIAWGGAKLAIRKIGGQTGDVLGAIQQLAEVAALVAVLVM